MNAAYWAAVLDLATLDTFTITGRGTAHIVDIPDEFLQQRDPRGLVGEHVCLDGHVVLVEAVEARAVPWRPGLEALRRVSLLVTDARRAVVEHAEAFNLLSDC